ncbi:MAG: Smr/MutS family protein [Chloroflexota bacterium]
MDHKTFHVLEYDKVLERLAVFTSFSAGRELALALEPAADLDDARRRQAETREARLLLDTRTSVTIGGARDVRRPVDNAQRGFTLPPEELLEIQATLVAGRNLRRQLERAQADFPHLFSITDLIEDAPGLVLAISNTLDERGEVLDSASEKLARLRKELRVAYGRIQDRLQSILNSTLGQFLQEPLVTMRSGRYVIPLKADAKGRIKGIVHDVSGSGATLWVEPLSTVELNNEYRSLQIQEQEEIERILAELSALVAHHGEAIKRVVERLAEMDLIFARANYAAAIKAVEPEFMEWRTPARKRPPAADGRRPMTDYQLPIPNPHPGSTIWLKAARHPLLDPAAVVPTDVPLDDQTFLVLITGPNTGGKTVSLKTIGLMVLMAQAGLHVPAAEFRLTLFHNIFADIGDEQSIEQSLSTFSSHITNIIRILAQVNDHSLVLLDELGSGTDPAEGAALAQAIVSFLRDKGATTFVATHYPELKLYASQTPGAVNASLLFDVETLAPTYEMTIGLPGRSNAFAIARRLGLDETVLDEAMRLIGAGSAKAESLLETVYELRDKLTAQEAAGRLYLRQLERSQDELDTRLQEIQEERQRVLQEAREQARQQLEAVQEEIRQARKRLRDAESLNALKNLSKQVTQLQEEKSVLVDGVTAPIRKSRKRYGTLQIGDTVLVRSLNMRGQVIGLGRDEAEIAVGRLHLRAGLDDLEFEEREEEEEPMLVGVTDVRQVGIELDIRGMRVEEGLAALERHLDAAFLSSLPWVRIIHGKGTGRLRQAVREALKQNSHVRTWEEGRDGEGGEGVTVAKLVK